MHEAVVQATFVSALFMLSVGVPVIVGPLDKGCVVVVQLARSTEAIAATISTRIERIVVI